jgi:hypothetical protein
MNHTRLACHTQETRSEPPWHRKVAELSMNCR